jgi:hypothetical protein
MTKDRAADRHLTPSYPYRPDPPDLLERLDERIGVGLRSRAISELLSRWLAGEPMPGPNWWPGNSDKAGQDHGE